MESRLPAVEIEIAFAARGKDEVPFPVGLFQQQRRETALHVGDGKIGGIHEVSLR